MSGIGGTLASALIVSASLWVAGGSGAAADYCKTYAETAVAQQKENEASGCGLAGLRWHANLEAHETFCRLAGAGNVVKETEARQAELDACLAVAAPQVEEAEGPTCEKSDIAEGIGPSKRLAEEEARNQLGLQRAQFIHDGLSKCRWYDLGCTRSGDNHTCYMSVSCCERDP